jgi:hypothetical protein
MQFETPDQHFSLKPINGCHTAQKKSPENQNQKGMSNHRIQILESNREFPPSYKKQTIHPSEKKIMGGGNS